MVQSSNPAATPPTHKSFSGAGGNYENQSGHWAIKGTQRFHLTTSGKYYYSVKKYRIYIKSFSGTYTTSCNGSHPVRATFILIHPNGSFSFAFKSHGAHVRIWGQFTGRGDIAKVNYLVNFSGSSTNPSGLSSNCATWVHGTATAG